MSYDVEVPVKTIPDIVRVLLVEHDADDGQRIRELLESTSRARFAVKWVPRLRAGLDELERGGYEVVLLDLNLPDGLGLQSVETAYSLAPQVPIIVLTGLDDEARGLLAVQGGAQDYLVKGKVTSSALVRAVRFVTEKCKRAQVERALAVMEAEFSAAREIQGHLFPSCPPALHGFDLAGKSLAAVTMSGDWYDFFTTPQATVVVIGDVSGHGFGSALLMAAARGYLRALAQTCEQPEEILDQLNRLLVADLGHERFITMTLAMLDHREHVLRYAVAGHPPGYVVDRYGRARELSTQPNLPLGIDDQLRFLGNPALPVDPGDVICFVTDGLLEASRDDGEAFELGRTLDTVRENRARGAQQILDSLYRAVDEFCGCVTHRDDISAVVLKAGEG